MVDKFKTDQRESGKKIDLKGLSPKTVKSIMVDINESLDDYVQIHDE